MHKFFWVLLFFFSSLSAALPDWAPVLYEGRYHPWGTLPEEGKIEELSPFHDEASYKKIAGTPYLQSATKSRKYPSPLQLKTELWLFRLPLKWLLIGAYLIPLALFRINRKWAIFALVFAFFLHTTLLALRSFILERPPVSNMTETLLYVPWVTVLLSLFFLKRPLIIPSATISASLLLFFLPPNPSLRNVPAVLDSQYWLLIHVLMVVGSYGVFFLSGVLGHAYLLLKKPLPLLEKTLLQTLYLGTGLLIGGTILGGFWAARSWGRFWDWDPKEAWAFISSALYLIWIHAYRFKMIGGRGLAAGSIIGLIAITFTWYGVNYLLGTGLHSYGFGEGGKLGYIAYLVGEMVFLAIFLTKPFTKIE
ncbi:MAG: Cytochrome c biogenesis protein CcsA [Chlamydiae bacterium]|nr:Cytochrome c biogenesis protein CcsA [Chlamydiota bacterium]